VELAPVMPAEQLPARDSPRYTAQSTRPLAPPEPCLTYRCLSRPIRLRQLFAQEEGEVSAAASWSQAQGADPGVVLDPWVSPQRYCTPKGFGIAHSSGSQTPPGPAGCRLAARVLLGAGVPGLPCQCSYLGLGRMPRSAHSAASTPCEG